MRSLFPVVSDAIRAVMPPEKLRYLGLSHFEADESGALNEFLAAAPQAVAVCSQVAAMTSIGDFAMRAPRPLADDETLALGRHVVRWFDTPHVPHAWECGLMMDETTRTLLCGDLFTQGGKGEVARGVPPTDGLLCARTPDERRARAPRARITDDARLHARQRLARRRCAAVARAGNLAGVGLAAQLAC